MRSFKQVVLLIVVLNGLIALVTYVAHFRNAAPRNPHAPLSTTAAPTPRE